MRADLHPNTNGLVDQRLSWPTAPDKYLKRPSVKNSEWTAVSVNVNHLAEKA